MTENKRFTIHLDRLNPYKWNVFDGDKFVCQNDYKKGAENIRDLLNALHEENHLLKFELKECRDMKLYSRRKLEKENQGVRDIIIDLDKSEVFWDRDTLINVIKSIANELGVDLE